MKEQTTPQKKRSADIEELRMRLQEAEETLRAIRSGEVDALVVATEKGERIFTLQSADVTYRLLVEAMNEGAAVMTSAGDVLYCNRHLAGLLKKPLEQIIGGSLRRFIKPACLQDFDDLLRQGLKSEGVKELALLAGTSAGITARFSISPIPMEGTPAVCLVVTDLTRIKQVEEALRRARDELELRVKQRTAELAAREEELSAINEELTANMSQLRASEESLRVSEQRYRTIMEQAADAVFVHDAFGRIIDGNQKAFQSLGYTREELLCRSIGDIDTDAIMADKNKLWSKILEEGTHYTFESRQVRKNGSSFPVEVTLGRVDLPSGAAILGIVRDNTERKHAEIELRASEQRVRRKLDSLLAPEGDISTLQLGDIFDIPALQSLMDIFGSLVPMTMAILDINGRVLISAGFQDICTKYHRAHPETCRYCLESDTQLSAGVPEGRCKLYKCRNNLWDIATPIFIGGRHIGNLFAGQFFFEDEVIDYELFRAQARRYGFNEDEYMAALDAVPRVNRKYVDACMAFFMKFNDIISKLSYGNVKLARARAQQDALTDALRESEERFKAIADYTVDCESWFGTDGRLLWINRSVMRITGFSPQECLAMPDFPLPIIHPDDRAAMAVELEAAAGGGKRENFEFRFVRKDNTIIWGSGSYQPIFDAAGKSLGYRSSVRDITDRKQAEEALLKANKAYRALSECNEAVARSTDESELLQEAVRILQEACGYRMAWIGYAEHDADKTVRPVAKAGCDDNYLDTVKFNWADTDFGRGPTGRAIRTGAPVINQNTLTNPAVALWRDEALKRGYAASAAVPLSSGGETIGALSVYSETPDAFTSEEMSLLFELCDNLAYGIRALRAVKKHLRVEEERRRLLAAIEQTSDNIIITDEKGSIQYVNASTCRLRGAPREEILGMNMFFPAGAPETIQEKSHEIWRTISSGRIWQGKVDTRATDGNAVHVEALITPIKNAAGETVNYVSVSRDVTREMQLEEQLRQSQKLEAIGTLAGGIAHDFNNILSPIILQTEMVAENLPETSPDRAALQKVVKAASRAADLVNQILTFSRQVEHAFVPVKISSIIKETVKFLRASIPATIEIVTKIQDESPLVLSDPTQMHQVIMNLCTNAFYAMREKGGVLSISLDALDRIPEGTEGCNELTPGPHVRLIIQDTGEGIDGSVLPNIFNPFFTTKPVGEGTGLGLSVVYGIVKTHSGSITVASAPGQGTAFTIYLPRITQKAPEQAAGEEIVPRGDNEHVLLVDDELFLAESLRVVLTHLGYRVSIKTESSEALAAFSASPQDFDAVITDLTMKGLTGLELTRRVKAIRPDIPVILCTGNVEDIDPKVCLSAGVGKYLKKPVRKNILAKVLREMLGKD